jgi:hypothetical protein
MIQRRFGENLEEIQRQFGCDKDEIKMDCTDFAA